jgi:hypothetical protein
MEEIRKLGYQWFDDFMPGKMMNSTDVISWQVRLSIQ